jgi:hypothetical protein
MPWSSRRSPWPYDALINTGSANTLGLLLRAGQDGQLVSTKTKTLENDPSATVTDYSSDPTYRQRTFAFRHLSGGVGERVQSSLIARRYRYAVNVQRWGDLFGKGPLYHALSPSLSGSIKGFLEALHGGVLTQFILAGQYVLRRDDDTSGGQAVSVDFGPGRTATCGVRFMGSYPSPVDSLLVTTDIGALWQYDGTTWNAATLPIGFAPTCMAVAGPELWLGGGSQVRKVTGDPLQAASYLGIFTVGDGSQTISSLAVTDGRVFAFCTSGKVFTFNTDGSDNDLFPGLRATPSPFNGANAQSWLDTLWVTIGDGFYKIDNSSGNATIEVVGPERLRDAEPPIVGRVMDSAGWASQHLYLGSFNPQTGNSALLTYGAWEPPPEDRPSLFRTVGATAAYEFISTMDGALVVWPAQTITALEVSGIAAPDQRLYCGFQDGTYGWIKLVANPFTIGSGAEFTLGTSTINLPLHHAMAQSDNKVLMGFTAFGPSLSPNDYINVSYRTHESGPYNVVGNNYAITGLGAGTFARFRGVTFGQARGSLFGAAQLNLLGSRFMQNGQRVDTPDGVVGKLLDIQISLVNTTSGDTPVIEGIGVHERVVPSLELDLSMTVRAADYQAKRDGSVDRKKAEEIRAALRLAAATPGSVVLTLPDETIDGLAFINFEEHLLNPNQRAGLAWDIMLQATQFRTQEVYGTFGRFKGTRFGDIRGVTFQGAKGF